MSPPSWPARRTHPDARHATGLCPANKVDLRPDLASSTNLIIMLGMMQVSKRIPFDDPFTLTVVRGCYIASNVIIGLIYLYVQTQVNKKKGTQTSTANPCATDGAGPHCLSLDADPRVRARL